MREEKRGVEAGGVAIRHGSEKKVCITKGSAASEIVHIKHHVSPGRKGRLGDT